MISFLVFHIAQSSAHIPIRICFAVCMSTALSHVPNNVLMLVGGCMLKAIWIEHHNNFASGHSRKRCLIISLWSQKQHLELPMQLLLSKLSLVKMTPLWANNMKILIQSGTLIFHMCKDLDNGPESIKSRYIDFTEKISFAANFQWIVSSWSDSWTSINPRTRCNHTFHRSPTRDCLN